MFFLLKLITGITIWSSGTMGRLKDVYIEMHTLEWDIINSACGNCEFVSNCRYYYGECPHDKGED